MQHFTQVIDGIDGSRAELVGYVIDNSPEMDPDRRRPAILIIPGGGYAIGSDRESEPVALQFLAAGYQAFVLKYSCAPSRYPVALLEMAEAMSMIRGHADEWHVDAGRVAAIGFSAGGHLAANLTTVSSDAELRDAGYDLAGSRTAAVSTTCWVTAKTMRRCWSCCRSRSMSTRPCRRCSSGTPSPIRPFLWRIHC